MARFQPALLGGVVIGVLSGLPFVNIGNCCCCLWVVLGGVLTVYLQQQAKNPLPIETSEAVLGGLIAGAVGAFIGVIIDVALSPLVGPMQMQMAQRWFENLPNIPPEARDQIDQAMRQGAGAQMSGKILGLFITLPVYAVFAMLGALLGLAFFRKSPPPAPQV
jgi:hypothetical protein